MVVSLLFLSCGAVLFAIGGMAVSRGSALLAQELGFTPLVIGLVVMSGSAALPELFLLVRAHALGGTELALGGIFGSVVALLSVIVGAVALFRPLDCPPKVVIRDGGVVLLIALIGLLLLLIGGGWGRLGGVLLLLLYGGYTALVHLTDRRRVAKHSVAEVHARAHVMALGVTRFDITVGLFVVLLGMIAIMMAGHLTVSGALAMARLTHLPQFALGVSVVALCLAGPQAVVLWAGTRHSGADIFFGQIVGAGVLNLTLAPGLVALFTPLPVTGTFAIDLIALAVLPVLLGLTVASGWRLTAPRAMVLIGAYACYLVVLAMRLNLLSYLPTQF